MKPYFPTLTHDFHKLLIKTVAANFSVPHAYLCYLSGNFDKPEQLFSNLEYGFNIIAFTETWNLTGNANFYSGPLAGYQNHEEINGSTLKGDRGFYIKNKILLAERKDLSKKQLSSQSEHESKWIETMRSNKENIVGVIYEHLKQKEAEFLQYLKQTFKTLSKENKKVILTADFNRNSIYRTVRVHTDFHEKHAKHSAVVTSTDIFWKR